MLGGRYRLLEPIGRGGMGTVWRARDEVLGREIAIKEINPPPGLVGEERETFAARTFREARAAGRLSHPSVATVYDVLEEHGHPWIAMELLPFRTLGALVRARGPMSPSRAAGVGLQILAALEAAHRAGVLHRDVKPDNVLLSDHGRAVLTDFGIATVEGDPSVTRTGAIIGTPAFIAPERASGGPAQRASDLWSLGVTLYVAVEGRAPFHRAHALATLAAVLNEEPAPFAHAGALAPVITGLLRKDPATRTTAAELGPRLRAIAAGPEAPEPTMPIAFPPPPPSPAPAPRRPAPAAVPARPPERRRAGTDGTAVAPRRGPRTPVIAGLVALVVGVAVIVGAVSWLLAPAPGQRPDLPGIVVTPSARTGEPVSGQEERRAPSSSQPPPAEGDARPSDPAAPPAAPQDDEPRTDAPGDDETGTPQNQDQDQGQSQGQGQGQSQEQDQDQAGDDSGSSPPASEAPGEVGPTPADPGTE
nr:serine/threonine-protein kinase [Microtetraspora sp. NBRC 13810]